MKFIAIFPIEADKSLANLSVIRSAISAIEDWKLASEEAEGAEEEGAGTVEEEEGGEEGAGELEPEEKLGEEGTGDTDLLLLENESNSSSPSSEDEYSVSENFLLEAEIATG